MLAIFRNSRVSFARIALVGFVGSVVTALAPVTEAAKVSKKAIKQEVRVLDTNNDRAISIDEFLQPQYSVFALADKNRDGHISISEAASLREAKMQVRQQMHFAILDRNGDGLLSKKEWNGKDKLHKSKKDIVGLRRLLSKAMAGDSKSHKDKDKTRTRKHSSQSFTDIDRNGDKGISLAELKRSHKPGLRMLQKLDADGNEAISLAEFTEKSRRIFAKSDLDNDGLLSMKDLREAMKSASDAHKAKKRDQKRGKKRDGRRGSRRES